VAVGDQDGIGRVYFPDFAYPKYLSLSFAFSVVPDNLEIVISGGNYKQHIRMS
jgi:hypothetical protein